MRCSSGRRGFRPRWSATARPSSFRSKIGRDYGSTVEIVTGLQPTDQVIVAPSDSLISGTRVRIARAPAAPSP